MAKVKSDTLHVKGIDVGIYTEDYRNEYISLTDIARFRNSDDPRFAIQNWMRNRNTIEFLGLWESLHNPNFNRVQFDTFRTEATSSITNDLITLSQVLTYNSSHIIKIRGHPRQYTAFLAFRQGKPACFLSPS